MYFNIGVLSPRVAVAGPSDAKWRSELAWWDFNAEVLDHQPEGGDPGIQGTPGAGSPGGTTRTSCDAGRRADRDTRWSTPGCGSLRATGFMHNRARMITASFLTKHLLIDWRAGEAVFRGPLALRRHAQNIGNWQWVAGCGYDASPYFRVLNPVSQGEKFDPQGDYVRQWVPELAHLPGKAVHRPWALEPPPPGYPAPMIDLDAGRDRFLQTARRFLRRDGA